MSDVMSDLRSRVLAALDTSLANSEWAAVSLVQLARDARTSRSAINIEFGSKTGLAVAYVVHWLDVITVLEPAGGATASLSYARMHHLVEPAVLIGRRRITRLARLIADTHPGVTFATASTFLETLVRESAANVLVGALHTKDQPMPSRGLNEYLALLAAG